MKRLILLLAAALSLVSCGKVNKSYYPVSEMISVDKTKSVYTNDNGVNYHITNVSDIAKINNKERVYVEGRACIPDEKDSAYDYDLEISSFYDVIIKNTVKASSSEEGYGDSPVSIQNAWFANSYLNVLTAVSYQKATGYKGEINLVFDDTKSTDSEIYFILENKQEGETWENPEMTEGDVEFGLSYYSFKYLDLLPAGTKGNVKVTVTWKWFDANTVNPSAAVPSHNVSVKSDSCEINLE